MLFLSTIILTLAVSLCPVSGDTTVTGAAPGLWSSSSIWTSGVGAGCYPDVGQCTDVGNIEDRFFVELSSGQVIMDVDPTLVSLQASSGVA